MSEEKTRPQPDTRHRRIPELGGKDFDVAAAIIDATRICQLGFVLDGQPYVVPMACARSERELIMHGSVASRLATRLDGARVCATITHLDGIVLSRSAFHSSMNYRSVMIFGKLHNVTDTAAKEVGFERITEQLAPGRLADVRPSTRKEVNATCLLSLPIEVFTTKVSDDPPEDAKADLDAEVWSGTVPLITRAGTPIDAPNLKFDLPPPDYLKDY